MNALVYTDIDHRIEVEPLRAGNLFDLNLLPVLEHESTILSTTRTGKSRCDAEQLYLL